MAKSSMMDIHIDALAYAAGVLPPAHLAVSHAPDVKRIPRRRLSRLVRSTLRAVTRGLVKLTNALDRRYPDPRHLPQGCQ